VRIKLYFMLYVCKEGSDLDVSSKWTTVAPSSPSSRSSPGFALPDTGTPPKVLERVCDSPPPLLPSNCTTPGRDSPWETKVRQYGAPTAMASWQFSGPWGCKGESNLNSVVHEAIGTCPLLDSHSRCHCSPPLTTLDMQRCFVSLGLTSEGLEGANNRGADMSSFEYI